MENATKALLIAAGILMLVMILSLLVIAYNNTSNFFQSEHENTVIEQLERFNNQFDNYSESTVRGNEMLSIINKVIDYNSLQAENEGYEEITLTIKKMDNSDVINQFKYEESDTSILTGINSGGSKALSEKVTYLLNQVNGEISYIKESHLQQLNENISYILVTNSDDQKDIDERNRRLKNIFKEDIGSDTDLLEKIQKITRQYHQLVQFKRANFKCIEIVHDSQTGRVSKMIFEIVLDSNGRVIFE